MAANAAAPRGPDLPLKKRRSDRVRMIYRYRWFYLMMLPGLVYFAIYHYAPMAGLAIAFQDYSLLRGISGSTWVGFDNFRFIFERPDFARLMSNTLIISLYRIIFGMLPDVLLALLLNEVRTLWFKKAVQTITYGPYFLSWVIIYGVAYAFLSNSGLVNYVIERFGGQPVGFLTSSEYFRSILVVTDIWKSTGYGAIIYLAALAAINPQLYEAAVVDGAGRFRQMWHITLPGIRDVFVLLLILRIGNILEAGFDQVYIFLNSRVLSVGDILDTWVFRMGLEQLQFSISAAMGFFKSFIGLILVLLANQIAKKLGGNGLW
ncbi:ABC transporter permease [Paenibacillus senegalensis]|uniref:ABC transporter permease n=1 Tax=Paenibacillus senegalensis TaxID=1465766 RepID=UPI00028867A1|nr:ABC transporter permease subunit [Paenibacillus senegalensis]